jgi:hypothetical protein
MTRDQATAVVNREMPYLFEWKREELIKKLMEL